MLVQVWYVPHEMGGWCFEAPDDTRIDDVLYDRGQPVVVVGLGAQGYDGAVRPLSRGALDHMDGWSNQPEARVRRLAEGRRV
jgi:hypothetical protein